MGESEKDVAWMQIYGQAYWHQPAKIYGDGLALTALRDALNKALEDKKAETVMFSSDGEGYELSIHLVSYEELGALPCHYVAQMGRTQWDDGYNYASEQLLPMIRSLQERLRKLEGTPLRKDKLMQAAEREAHIGTPEDMGKRFVDAWHRAERGEEVNETHVTIPKED